MMGLHNKTFDIFFLAKNDCDVNLLTEKVNACLRLASYFFISCLDLISIHKNKIHTRTHFVQRPAADMKY